MSDLEITGFFGHPNAADDLIQFHQRLATQGFEKVKLAGNGNRIFITGVFGSGKSAALQRVQSLAPEKRLIWAIDEQNPPSSQLNLASQTLATGQAAYLSANILLWQLAHRIYSSSGLTKEVRERVIALFPGKIKAALTKLGKATSVGDPFGVLSISISEMMEQGSGPFQATLHAEEWRKAIEPALKERPAFALIDDAELLFPGFGTSTEATDGLLYAVHLVNAMFGPSLTMLIAYQFATHLFLERRSQRFEKVVATTYKLRWRPEDLRSLLLARMREGLQLAEQVGDADVFGRKFGGPNEGPESVVSAMVGLSVNGPRDLIALANASAHVAGRGKISSANIRSALGDFGQIKLMGIEREFDKSYPGIRQFLSRFFTAGKASYSQSEFSAQLSEWLVKARDELGGPDWLLQSGRQIVGLLYDIGFIGYCAVPKSRPVYVAEDPFARNGNALYLSAKYVIHPVFRSALGIV